MQVDDVVAMSMGNIKCPMLSYRKADRAIMAPIK